MKRLIKPIVLASLTGAMLVGTTNVMAQQRGAFDPAQFREQQLQRYQESFGFSAEEWKAVQPMFESVMDKRTETLAFAGRGGGFGGGRRGGGGGGGGGRGGFGQPAPEVEALQQAVESGTTSEIKAKLEAYREARAKKEAALKEAREKLRKVLNAKQEAQTVVAGLLD